MTSSIIRDVPDATKKTTNRCLMCGTRLCFSNNMIGMYMIAQFVGLRFQRRLIPFIEESTRASTTEKLPDMQFE